MSHRKGHKDKQWFTKYYKKSENLGYMNPIKIREFINFVVLTERGL